jgi:hypothetical protein
MRAHHAGGRPVAATVIVEVAARRISCRAAARTRVGRVGTCRHPDAGGGLPWPSVPPAVRVSFFGERMTAVLAICVVGTVVVALAALVHYAVSRI